MIVNHRTNYPSVWIKDPIDNTISPIERPDGWILGVGYMPLGNPLKALHIAKYNRKLASTNPLNGGNANNELGYHLKDYFMSYPNGVVKLGRKLGIGSTIKVIKVTKPSTTLDIDEATLSSISIYNDMANWENTASTGVCDVLVMLAPAEKFTIRILNEVGVMSIILQDYAGTELGYYTGSVDKLSVDDYGVSNYIGNVVNADVIKVKVNTAHADYMNSFDITKTFQSGIVTEVGVVNSVNLQAQLEAIVGNCDYVVGLGNVEDIVMLNSVGDKGGISKIFDLKSANITQAISDKNSLALGNVSDALFIWNRVKYSYTSGSQNIGLSGYIAGKRVLENISRKIGTAESRMSGIAGLQHAITQYRSPSDEVTLLTDTEKTLLTNERINTIDVMQNQLIISDILSANKLNTYMKSFPIADSDNFISRAIGRFIEDNLFKNMNVAVGELEKLIPILIKDCRSANYFSNIVTNAVEYTITPINEDTISVEYSFVPAGVTRKGIVQPIIRKIERNIG